MLECSDGYRSAIVGDARRIFLKAVIDIIDPDITYGSVSASSESRYSKRVQLHDKDFTAPVKYATLELNRWVLDGSWGVYPDNPAELTDHMGFQSEVLCGEEGAFSTPAWVEMAFSNVSILQACSVYFSDNPEDGIPTDFTVEVKQGGTAYYTRTFTGNREPRVSMDGFTVQNPDAIRVTVTRWSVPFRRFRAVEIVPGIYEEWTQDTICEFSARQETNFSCLALPYGTCTLKMDNLSRRFEPRSKNGVFQSIDERQAIPVAIGVRLADGSVEYKQIGVFYQYNGGWRTGNNGLSMQWDLVDIVGLLAGREFIQPSVLPTTLEGWLAALAAQLGPNFEGHYKVDPAYADLPVTASSAADVAGKKCGDILRFACMATGTFPRADAATGYLTAEPYWYQGNKLDLDNMTAYPTMKANDDLAAITFKLYDGSGTQYIVSGNATAASQTVTVDNPFLHTQAAALTAARQILSTYGGNLLEVTGRGDMSSEIGDVDTVWLDQSSASTGRRRAQGFTFSNGLLKNCPSVLLQADGSFLFEERVVLTESGTWTGPAGVGKLRLILVGPGADGTDGTDGDWDAAGLDGVDGVGGLVWAGTVDINDQQIFSVSVTEAGTIFGPYSSANGQRFPLGYTDIASGASYARTGVKAPLAGSGDGGAGGRGGAQGRRHRETTYGEDGKPNGSKTVIDVRPGNGTVGTTGVTGCAVIYWDKEST